MQTRRYSSLLLILASGCGTSGPVLSVRDAGVDGGERPDATRRDAGIESDAEAESDAGVGGPWPTRDDCEAVFAGVGTPACAPGTMAFCGEERCCTLRATCVDGMLEATETLLCDNVPEPSCALGSANATITVVVDGATFTMNHAYANHGVGFGTYVDLTFTPDGRADVCSTQRLSISSIFSSFDVPASEPAYNATHEVTFQWTDETATPRFRFFQGEVTITSSLSFRMGGPVAGSLSADEGALRVSGSFVAPECEPWRTSGS